MSVKGGSLSYAEDEFGRKLDRCVTDFLIKSCKLNSIT